MAVTEVRDGIREFKTVCNMAVGVQYGSVQYGSGDCTSIQNEATFLKFFWINYLHKTRLEFENFSEKNDFLSISIMWMPILKEICIKSIWNESALLT